MHNMGESAGCCVHCRTGSLEIITKLKKQLKFVHCRTGSLEILKLLPLVAVVVHCRTGSLESAGGLNAE